MKDKEIVRASKPFRCFLSLGHAKKFYKLLADRRDEKVREFIEKCNIREDYFVTGTCPSDGGLEGFSIFSKGDKYVLVEFCCCGYVPSEARRITKEKALELKEKWEG